MAVHPHRYQICISLLSVIKSFPFGFSLSFSRLVMFSLSSCLWFVFHSISFVFRSYEFIFELFLPFLLLAVLYQLLACSPWQFHHSIASGSFANWATWTLSLPLAADFLLWGLGCIFASDGDVLPWQRLNLGKPAFCGFIFVDLDRNPVPAITIPMAQTTDF